VAPNGQVTGVRLVAGSGYELLDQEALNLLTRAAPLPAFPPGLPPEPLALTLPVSFTLR
jgi:protein TonB